MSDRRDFLRFLAASPLYAGLPWAAQALAQAPDAEPMVTRAQDALDVFDLEKVASKTIPMSHWGYLMTGVDGEETLRANREAYAHWQLRTRRLVDLSKMDMSVELFGHRYASPIFLCPLGYQKAFNPGGEVAVARAAKTRDALQILSTVSSTSIDDVIKAREAPIWYQLYTTNNLDVAIKLVKQAEAAGAIAVAMTVDLPIGRNTETATRLARADTRTCTSCHGPTGPSMTGRPMFAGLGLSGPLVNATPALTWDFIRRLKDATNMKVLVKGLESGEDAALAVKYGCDGVMVSNHGGRATETARGTLQVAPWLVETEIQGAGASM